MKVVRLLVVLSSIISCFAYCGCNSSNGQHFLTWTAIGGVEIRVPIVSSWSEISDWLCSKSSVCYRDTKGINGYACFMCELGYDTFGRSEEASVWFANYFAPGEVEKYQMMHTMYGENLSSRELLFKGFPLRCKGIVLDGLFDLSKAELHNGIVGLRWKDGDRIGNEHTSDFIATIPQFHEGNNLKILEIISFFPYKDDECYHKVLDLSVLEHLDKLENFKLDIGCCVSGIKHFLQGKSLRAVKIYIDCEGSSLYEKDDEPSRLLDDPYINLSINDETFDTLYTIDFSRCERVDLRIDLKALQSFDIERIFMGNVNTIYIKSRNCIIEGMDKIPDDKLFYNFQVLMDFDQKVLRSKR